MPKTTRASSDGDRAAPGCPAGQRKIKSKELAAYIGITEQNLSLLKSGKVKGIRFSTLEKICERLECQPGDIIRYEPGTSASEDGSEMQGW